MKIEKLILFFVTILICSKLVAQPDRLALIGNGQSFDYFNENVHQSSLYSFGKNPAGVLTFYKNPWLRAAASTNFQNGEFRRELDPESQFQLNFFVEGLKKMHDKKSAFYGYIQYYNENLLKVHRGLEYEPYHDIFTAIDTTVGSFDYYGPKLVVEYGREVFSFLSFGTRIRYRIREGLKREPSKTKVTGRLISGDIGAIANLPHSAKLGILFSPFSFLYRLNANKQFLPSYPVIFKYFGDSLLVKNDKVSVYNRKIADSGYRLNFQADVPIGKSFVFLMDQGLYLEYRDISENISEGKLDVDDYGSWQRTGRFLDCLMHWHPQNFPIGLEINYLSDNWNSWARTPRYQTLFEEMKGGNQIWSYGLRLEFSKLPVSLSVNTIFQRFSEQKNNYYQHYEWKRKLALSRIRSNLTYRITKDLKIHFRMISGESVPEYHLSMDEVKFSEISGGIDISLNDIILNFYGTYQKITPMNSSIQRQRFFLLFQVTQLL